MRMPTRLTSWTAALPEDFTSAHTTAYRSPDEALAGTAIVASTTASLPGDRLTLGFETFVQEDSSFGSWPGAGRKSPWLMDAAAGYRLTSCAVALRLLTASLRLKVVPGLT